MNDIIPTTKRGKKNKQKPKNQKPKEQSVNIKDVVAWNLLDKIRIH